MGTEYQKQGNLLGDSGRYLEENRVVQIKVVMVDAGGMPHISDSHWNQSHQNVLD